MTLNTFLFLINVFITLAPSSVSIGLAAIHSFYWLFTDLAKLRFFYSSILLCVCVDGLAGGCVCVHSDSLFFVPGKLTCIQDILLLSFTEQRFDVLPSKVKVRSVLRVCTVPVAVYCIYCFSKVSNQEHFG